MRCADTIPSYPHTRRSLRSPPPSSLYPLRSPPTAHRRSRLGVELHLLRGGDPSSQGHPVNPNHQEEPLTSLLRGSRCLFEDTGKRRISCKKSKSYSQGLPGRTNSGCQLEGIPRAGHKTQMFNLNSLSPQEGLARTTGSCSRSHVATHQKGAYPPLGGRSVVQCTMHLHGVTQGDPVKNSYRTTHTREEVCL
jgi:hypothetical protein